ncbi:MAG: tRNA (adenosine(37)-N6)-dimethylallyltransferase MiaA [Firmicutes bacterium]|nr:tRNA (adenosine(37)-N6)-dimethylallyltransferase MiaA [Bacillota bacterium]
MSKLIVIVGPTAVGKTSLSLEIAQQFDGEIVSADAMQFYKGLDIGTAKIKYSEMKGIKHHLIDFLEPQDSFSVADFQKIVRNKIDELMESGKNVVVVGGSGLYLQAALFDYDFQGQKRSEETKDIYKDFSNSELYDKLLILNKELATSVHPNNRRRLLRSLEIAEAKSPDFLDKGKQPIYPEMILIGIQMERAKLYDSINQRVDHMFEEGLIEEVRTFYNQGLHSQSMLGIGYKEVYQYLDGKISLDEAKDLIKQHSRNYAKRQLTWFHNKLDIPWFEVNPILFHQTVEDVIQFIKKVE